MALKYLYVPSGYKAGTAYGVLPNDSSADFGSFSRPSFATRTNKDGLLETYQTFGNNLVTNGDFATDSNWVKGNSSVTISGGKANFTNTSNGNTLQQDNFLTAGKRYEVSFTVSNYTEGSVRVGRPFVTPSVNSNGVHTVTGIAVASSGGSDDLQLQNLGTTTLSIDDVSVKEIALNVPRIDYSDGGCPSLLLEPQRTNECRGSENVLAWNTNRSISLNRDSNQIISPDGSKSADLVTTEDENAGVSSLEMTTISNTVYSTSVYAKHIAGGSKLRFGISTNLHFGSGDKKIIVDLSDGSIVNNGLEGVAEPKVIDVGNGWYRLIIEHSSVVSGGGGGAHFFCYADDVSFSQFSVWGGQIEVGGYTSSYIPNYNTDTNSQTTRNRDKGNFAGNFDFNSAEGVLEARFKAFPVTTESRRITLGATDQNRVVLGYAYNGGIVKPFLLIVGSGNEDIYISMPSSFNIFDYNTYQLKFQSGNNELKINGELVDTDTSFNTLNFTFSASLRNVSFNYYEDSATTVFYGGVKHIKVYDSITDF